MGASDDEVICPKHGTSPCPMRNHVDADCRCVFGPVAELFVVGSATRVAPLAAEAYAVGLRSALAFSSISCLLFRFFSVSCRPFPSLNAANTGFGSGKEIFRDVTPKNFQNTGCGFARCTALLCPLSCAWLSALKGRAAPDVLGTLHTAQQ